jgi:hypothetical protein
MHRLIKRFAALFAFVSLFAGGVAVPATASPATVLVFSSSALARLAANKRRGTVTAPPVSVFSIDSTIGSGINASGYSVLPLRAGAHRYFVNSSTGSDASSCAAAQSPSTPKATMASAYGCLADGAGDQMLIAAGTTYSANVPAMNISGFSPTYPLVYQSYDPADPLNEAKYGVVATRPVVFTAGGDGTITCCRTTPSSYLAIRGLKFSPPDTGENVLGFSGSNGLGQHYVLLENNIFAQTEVMFQGDARDKTRGIVVRANMSYGAWSPNGASTAPAQGYYLDNIASGTVEDNTIYHSGWKRGASRDDPVASGGLDNGGSPNLYRHSIYMQDSSDLLIRRNAFIDPAITGCSCRGMVDMQKNVAIDNPISFIAGLGTSYQYVRPHGEWAFVTANAAFGDADINAINGGAAARGIAYTGGNNMLGSQTRYNLAARSRAQSSSNAFLNLQASVDSPASYMDYHDNLEYSFAPTATVISSSDSSPSGNSLHRTWESNYWTIGDGNTLVMPHGADFAHWDGLLSPGTTYRLQTNAITKTEGINLAITDGVSTVANFAVTNGVAIDQTFTTTTGTAFRIVASGDNFTGTLPNIRLTTGGGPDLLGGVTPTNISGASWTWVSFPGNFNISHRLPTNAYTSATLYPALGLGVTDKTSFITAIMDKPELRVARAINSVLMAGYNVPAPVAADLQISRNTPFIHNQPWTGNIMGALDGSTLTASGLPSFITIDGPNRRYSFDGTAGATSGTFSITETPTTGPPHTSTIAYTVIASPTLANLTIASPFVSGTPATKPFTGYYLSYADSVIWTPSAAPAGFSVDGFTRTITYDGTPFTGSPTATIREELSGATNTPHDTILALGGATEGPNLATNPGTFQQSDCTYSAPTYTCSAANTITQFDPVLLANSTYHMILDYTKTAGGFRVQDAAAHLYTPTLGASGHLDVTVNRK